MVERAHVRCPVCRSVVPAMLLWAVGDACPHCHRALQVAPTTHSRRVVRQHAQTATSPLISRRGWCAGPSIRAAPGDPISALQARHEQTVARTLERADEAAERGQHATPLGWLQTLEAIGDELSSEYQSKREIWRRALLA